MDTDKIDMDKIFPLVAEKPPRGRQKTDKPKIQRQIRVDDEEWGNWKSKADAAGISLSQWIRMRCNKGRG
jgi:hypothetical protein